MEGFTRVLFANLCRLCGLNRPEGKVNIFDETGKQRNLQEKLQALSIQVTVDDDLPKVVCGHCVTKLEDLYQFWSTCQSSTVLLNTFYNVAKDQEFFKSTGLVYISEQPNLGAPTVTKPEPKAKSPMVKVLKAQDMKPRVPEACTDCTNQNTTQNPQTVKAKQVQKPTVSTVKKPVKPINKRIAPPASVGKMMPALQYVCPDCSQTFNDHGLLMRHLRVHALKMIECQLCARTFRRKLDYDKHINMHRRKGEAPKIDLQVLECHGDPVVGRVLQTLTGFKDSKRLEPIITKSQRRDGKVEQI